MARNKVTDQRDVGDGCLTHTTNNYAAMSSSRTTTTYSSFAGILDRINAADARQLHRTTHVLKAAAEAPQQAAVVHSPPADSTSLGAPPELSQVTAASSNSNSTHQSSDSRTDADWNADFETTLATDNATAVNRFCSLVPFTTWCALSDTWLRSACRAGATEAARVLRSRGAAWPSAREEEEEEAATRRDDDTEEEAEADDTNVAVVPPPCKKRRL